MRMLLVLVGLLWVNACAEAEDGQLEKGNTQACPSHIKPNNPRVTGTGGEWGEPNSGIPLDTPVVKRVEKADGNGFFYYKMPIGYSTKWVWGVRATSFDPETEILEGNSWTFWMPEKRYPELPLGFSLMTKSHGCENGRPAPAPSQYLVTFQISKLHQYQGLYQKHYTQGTPEERWRKLFKNEEGDIELESGILTRNVTGQPYSTPKSLSSFRVPLTNISTGKNNVYYRNPMNHPFQFLFECKDFGQMLCSAQFYFPDRNLNISMNFTRDHLDAWNDILKSTLELLDRWKIAAPNIDMPK